MGNFYLTQKKKTYWLLAVLFLLTNAGAWSVEASKPGYHLNVKIKPDSLGGAQVITTYRFNEVSDASKMALTIFTGYENNCWGCRQRVTDITLKQNGIKLKPHRILSYHAERVSVLFTKVKLADLEFSYHISGVAKNTQGGSRYSIPVYPFYDEDILSAKFEIEGVKVTSWQTENGYEAVEKFTTSGNTSRMIFDDDGPTFSFTLDFDTPQTFDAPLVGHSLREQVSSTTLWVILVIFVICIVVRFLPVALSGYAAAGMMFYLASIFMAHQIKGALYFWRVYRFTGDSSPKENGLIDLFSGVMVVLIAVLLLQKIVQGRHQIERVAWYRVFVIPMMAIMVSPAVAYSLDSLLLTLATLAILIFWLRRSLAMYYGLGVADILEALEIKGEASVVEIAGDFGISQGRILELASQLPAKQVGIDFKNQNLYSVAAVENLNNYEFCVSCGGLTHSESADLVVCPWCGSDYNSSRTALPQRPVPIAVETTGELVSLVGKSLSIGFLFLAAIGLFIEFLQGFPDTSGWAVAGVLIVIALIVYAITDSWQGKLLKGKFPFWVWFFLILGIPLVFPLYLLIKLGTPRVRLFLNNKVVANLDKEILNKKEMSLADLARWLKSDTSEALDVVFWLVGNHLVDAVYERKSSRLIARELYRTKSKKNHCINCGGTLKLAKRKIICRYCGSENGQLRVQ